MAFLNKLRQKIFKTAFLGIVIDYDSCETVLVTKQGSKQVAKESRHFRIDENTPVLLIDYINATQRKYTFNYVSTLLNSMNQGGVFSCEKKAYDDMQIMQSNVNLVCVENRWSVYASAIDVKMMQDSMELLGGIDFIYSTILILYENFKNDFTVTPAVYVLKQKVSATLAIFDNERLLYSSYMVFENKAEEEGEEGAGHMSPELFEEEKETLGADTLLDLDEVAFELKDEISDFEQHEAETGQSEIYIDEIEYLESDLKLSEFIKSSLNDYYKNSLYNAKFVERIVVADPYSKSDDVIKLIENELMLPTEQKNIDVADTLVKLSMGEFGS